MKCPSCGRRSRSGANFCDACGARLVRICRSCRRELPFEARFCDACGAQASEEPQESQAPPARDPRLYTPRHLAEKTHNSRSKIEGERKHVTVLFADVKGSLALSEQVDPEDWLGIIDRFITTLAEGVHRFDGTVNQYTGDGIMALFGAPVGHEDHAQRACYAALHLRDRLHRYALELRRTQGLDFAVRMGLNSGEVVVGEIGDDLRMDYTALGPTVGLAARMERLAAADKVYLSEHTASLVSGYFRLADLGSFEIKGAQAPLRVYELQGVGPLRTRLDVSRARGFSRFVGRTEESQALMTAFSRAAEGNGQVLGVVGEPGVGKSRLCHEFLQKSRARGHEVYEAHCVAHGKGIPFLTLLQLTRSYFGITERDTDQPAREKIAGKLILLDEALGETLPVVFDFLGVHDPARPVPRIDPAARQRQLFEAIRQLLQTPTAQGPAVILIEDLHWMDGATEAFLESLVETTPGKRTLLIANFRPEYHARWMQKSHYQQLELLPLGAEATDELLRDLLGSDASLAELTGQIRERTGGNPFFIEEVVRSVLEAKQLQGTRGSYRLRRSLSEVSIPATVQAVLNARIDRLSERDKTVLQTAAVIGRHFTEPVLRRVVKMTGMDLAAAVQVLTSGEFLREVSLYPEGEYAFKHPLTREVAYHSQLAERRTQVHAAAARAITELYPDGLDERAPLLAHHWESAREGLAAAHWHRRAAEWAGVRDAAVALRHWRKVRALVSPLPEAAETMTLGVQACRGILNLGWRFGGSEELDAVFAEGKRLARRSGDIRALAVLVTLYGNVKGMVGDCQAYLDHVAEAVRLAERAGDPGLRSILSVELSIPNFAAGRVREALRLVEPPVEQAQENGSLASDVYGWSPSIYRVVLRGWFLIEAGRFAEAASQLAQAAALARTHGEVELLLFAQVNQARLAYLTGDFQSALGLASSSVEAAERIGAPNWQGWAYWTLGRANAFSGNWSEAVRILEEGRAISWGWRIWEARGLAGLAEAYLGAGDLRQAHEAAREALAVARRRLTRSFEPDARLAFARVLLRAEGVRAREKIESTLAAALAVVEETGARKHEPFIHAERAELARLAGDEKGRERELSDAHRLLEEMGVTGGAARLPH